MAEHAMPKGIKRVEKGVYRTLDDRHEIRQDGKVWRLAELLGDSQVGLGEFASRGRPWRSWPRTGSSRPRRRRSSSRRNSRLCCVGRGAVWAVRLRP
jgi:hypothetical protein